MISPEDYQIIQKLESNPLLTYSDLAEELGVSWPTAKKKLNDLRSRGIIRNPVAIYNTQALGLQRISIISSLKTLEDLQRLEKFCDIHPYTHYRARGYGNGFFLLSQFEVAPEAVPLMEELVKELQKKGFIKDSVFLLSSGLRTESFPDLNSYNPLKNQWNFDWKEWLKLLKNQPDTLLVKLETQEIDLKKWKLIDFSILREVTKNPEIKQAELMRKFNLSRTNTHLLYNSVFKNLISDIRLRYDRISFNLVNTRLFWVPEANQKKLNQLFNLFSEIPPPFRLNMDILQDKGFIIWAGALPNIHEHKLALSIWKLFQNFYTYTLDTSLDKSIIYWFYPENFDFQTHYWKIDREYIVDKPLEELSQL